MAEGHSGGNYDGTGHAQGEHHVHHGKAWRAGSRCINPDHIAERHTNPGGVLVLGQHRDYSSTPYTEGPDMGTSPATNFRITQMRPIGDNWEADLAWQAPRFTYDTDGMGNVIPESRRWACQPHTYQLQRRIGTGGTWDAWDVGSRTSEVRSRRFDYDYDGYGRAQFKYPASNAETTVHFRVCNKFADGTVGNCTGTVSRTMGGQIWYPRIVATQQAADIWEDTAQVTYSLQAIPAPDRNTTVRIKNASNNDRVQTVTFDTNGDAEITIPNPRYSNDSVFTGNRRVSVGLSFETTLHSGDVTRPDRSGLFLLVKEDDPILVNVDFPDTSPALYSVDGGNTQTTNPSGTVIHPGKFRVRISCNESGASWSGLEFESSDTAVVPSKTVNFGCASSFIMEAKAVGTFAITRGSLATNTVTVGRDTYEFEFTGDTTFSGEVVAPSTAPERLGVGFERMMSVVDEGDPITMQVRGYDYENRYQPWLCDPASNGEVNVRVRLADDDEANAQIDEVLVPLSKHCSKAVEFTLPPGREQVGFYTAKFNYTSDDNFEHRTEGSGSNRVSLTGYEKHSIEVRRTKFVVAQPTELRINEGSSANLRIRLNDAPTHDVTLDISDGCGGGRVCTSPTANTDDEITFTPSNWSSWQTINISAAHDTSTNDVTRTRTWTATSDDRGYSGEKVSITETMVDDDPGPPLAFKSGMQTTLSRDDKVTLRFRIPHVNLSDDLAQATLYRIHSIGLYVLLEDNVTEDGGHPYSDTWELLYHVPEPGEHDSNGIFEYTEYWSDGRELSRTRHYESGRDGEVEIYFWAPSDASGGRIKLFSASTGSKHTKSDHTFWPNVNRPADQAGCNNIGNSASHQVCRYVNYSTD